MTTHLITIVCMGFVFRCACLAQASSTPPRNWTTATPLFLDMGISRLQLSHNTPEAIRQELLDTNTVRLIAKSNGLSEKDLATVQVAQERGYSWVQIYQIGKSAKAFNVLSEKLRGYVQGREEGHTRAFLLAAITNRVQTSTISDPDLRALASKVTLLPLSWLKKEASGTRTNEAGTVVSRTITFTTVNGKPVTNETVYIPKRDEVCRWVSYTVSDGEIGWRYFVQFKADGSVDYVHDSKCDAKEYNAKFQNAIQEVETEVEAEMKKDGTHGQFGSVHHFWHLKQEKLKARGIEWRSPAELNPNTNYD